MAARELSGIGSAFALWHCHTMLGVEAGKLFGHSALAVEEVHGYGGEHFAPLFVYEHLLYQLGTVDGAAVGKEE